jgi:hypothetical protein
MKKILKISLLVFAMVALIVGCKKEDKKTIIGTWTTKEMEVIVTHNNPLFTAVINALTKQMIEDGQFNDLVERGTYVFYEDGKVVLLGLGADVEGTYTTNDKILTISLPPFTGYMVSGEYKISGKNLYWDLDATELYKDGLLPILDKLDGLISLDDLAEITKGITKVIVRVTFEKQ